MIFHKPTRTAIFLPTKSGSVSLRRMAQNHSDFVLCHGPASWNHRQLTPHVLSEVIDQVDDYPIQRRYLLFREPTARILSVWKFAHLRGECGPWSDWISGLQNFQPGGGPIDLGGWQSQLSYCPSPDGIIRTEHMIEDMYQLAGVTLPYFEENKTPLADPVVSQSEMDRMREIYADDYRLAAAPPGEPVGWLRERQQQCDECHDRTGNVCHQCKKKHPDRDCYISIGIRMPLVECPIGKWRRVTIA